MAELFMAEFLGLGRLRRFDRELLFKKVKGALVSESALLIDSGKPNSVSVTKSRG
jgi:hypothetical protein